MESAPGRRLSRPALTLVTALSALVAVAVSGDLDRLRSYGIFVVATAAVLALAAVVRPGTRR